MKKIAVLFATGFEEIEALTPVDVLRRAGFQCDMIGLTDFYVQGSHGIKVEVDSIFNNIELSDYDLIVLPGGMPGATNLREDNNLIKAIQKAVAQNRLVAAICAAPIVLEKAGLLENRQYTCYPGQEKEITTGCHLEENVVVDGQVITSRGAGTSLEFSYKLVEMLGGDAPTLAKSMVFSN